MEILEFAAGRVDFNEIQTHLSFFLSFLQQQALECITEQLHTLIAITTHTHTLIVSHSRDKRIPLHISRAS
jgi:hypothetical protein